MRRKDSPLVEGAWSLQGAAASPVQFPRRVAGELGNVPRPFPPMRYPGSKCRKEWYIRYLVAVPAVCVCVYVSVRVGVTENKREHAYSINHLTNPGFDIQRGACS